MKKGGRYEERKREKDRETKRERRRRRKKKDGKIVDQPEDLVLLTVLLGVPTDLSRTGKDGGSCSTTTQNTLTNTSNYA